MSEFDYFPEKPELVEKEAKKGGIAQTVLSIVIFALVFIVLIGNEISFLANLLIVLIIHESGHYIMMKVFKYKNVKMLFIPLMGAFVQGKKEHYSQKESMIVTAMGPFPGVILGGVLTWYAIQSENEYLLSLGLLFLVLNLINLIPLDPLDGGQLFKMYSGNKSELFLMIFSFISSLTIIVIGWFLSEYILIAFGFFMGLRVRAMQRNYNIHCDLDEEEVNYNVKYNQLSNRDFSVIKNVMIEHTPGLKKFANQVPDEEFDTVVVNQVNNVLKPSIERDAGFILKGLILLFWLLSFAIPVIIFLYADLSWFEWKGV